MPTIVAMPPQRAAAAVVRTACAAAAGSGASVPTGSVVSIGQIIVEGGDDSSEALVAAAPVFGGYAVMYAGAQGAMHADPTAPGYVLAGVSTQSGAQGASITVRSRGPFAFSGWSWTAGEPVFVLPGGMLTQAMPQTGVLHQVGAALDAVTLLIEPGEPITL